MIFETISVGAYGVNCYILAEEKNMEAVIIDPGGEPDRIKKILARHGLRAGIVINTHGHLDHIGADDAFGSKVYIHKDDLSFLDDPALNLSQMFSMPIYVVSEKESVEDNQEICFAGITLQVLHTPGHTPGGICLILKKPQGNIIFSGDTLFCQGIGRTDLPYGSLKQLEKSIREKLFVLDNQTKVFPGHGPSTTIGNEKENHHFFTV